MDTGTGLRVLSPAATRSLVRRQFAHLGITRVTNLTPLDRLGVPVCASVRPRGQTLAVHSGKGLTSLSAWVGAAMEALELAVAERAALADGSHEASPAEWAASLPAGLRPVDFAPVQGVAVDARAPLRLAPAEWLGSRSPVWLPVQDVHPCKPADEPDLYPWTSNGLASGNDLEEATLHAVLEVLERDALAMNAARDTSAWLDPSALPEPFVHWSEDWQRMGIELLVRQVPNDFGLPCFSAWIHEPFNLGVNLAGGSGLHTSRDIALARAVTEAAQSRLTTLHGGRDDLPQAFEKYHTLTMQERMAADAEVLARVRDRKRTVAWAEVPTWHFSHPHAALHWLRQHLAERGFPWILRRRLDGASPDTRVAGFAVVKVLVPRCESVEQNTGRIGPRLMARVLGHA